MKLGVFTPLFANKNVDEMLDYVKEAGLEAVEIGVGGYPGNHHCPVDEILECEEARKAYLKKFSDRGIIISAFSCHGNPIGPDPEFRSSKHVKTTEASDAVDAQWFYCVFIFVVHQPLE